MTAASERHLDRVRELPCVVCSRQPVEAHHIRQSGITGAGQRASDWFSMPLCAPCHAGFHKEPKTWEMRNGRQIEHIAQTLERLYGR